MEIKMKNSSKLFYTTALGSILLLSQPVFAQTGTGRTTNLQSDKSNTMTPSGTITTTPGGVTSPMEPADIMSTNPIIDKTWGTESAYWRNHYSSRPYYNKNMTYSTYEPAYRFGLYNYNQNNGKRYEDLDMAQLKSDWERMRGNSKLTWEQAQPAVQDAYNRIYENNNKSTAPTNQMKK
jgi:hypothetical protein